MKRKVALLLALVMVLSLLPMNVFGADPVNRQGSPRGTVTPLLAADTARTTEAAVHITADEANHTQNLDININASQFAGVPHNAGDLYLRFQLHGGSGTWNYGTEVAFRPGVVNDTSTESTRPTNANNNAAPGDGDPSTEGINLTFTGIPGGVTLGGVHPGNVNRAESNRRDLWVPVSSTTPFSDTVAMISVTIPTVVRHGDARLTVELVRIEEIVGAPNRVVREQVLVDQPLRVAGVSRGVTITADGTRPLVEHAILPSIIIDERSVDEITGRNSLGVKLIAPRGYRWDTQGLGFGEALRIYRNAAFANSGAWTVPSANWNVTFNVNTQRDELNILVPSGELARNGLIAHGATLGRLQVQNARLIATNQAPTTGNVNIDVYVRNGIYDAGVLGLAGVISNDFPTSRPAQGGVGDWQSEGLHVATRGAAGIEVVTREDTASGISGVRSQEWLNGGTAPEWLNRNFYSIRLNETAPNTIRNNNTNTFQFTILTEGARFQNANMRTYNGGTGRADYHDSWLAFDNETYTVPALTSLTRDVYTLTTRPVAGTATLRNLDVRFQIITEAGFEARNGGNVEVRVTGPGVDEVVTIATVVDPIRVLPSNVVTLARDNFGAIIPTTVNAVVIQETDVAMLQVGTVITPIVRTVMNGQPVALAQLTQPVLNVGTSPVVDATSGLILTPEVGSPGSYRVLAPSIDGPATITWNNITITGALLPGIEYHVEFRSQGTAFNLNNITRTSVPVDGDGGAGAINLVGTTPAEDIRFQGLTYSTQVVEVLGAADLFDPEEGPTGGDHGQGGGNQVVTPDFDAINLSVTGGPVSFVDLNGRNQTIDQPLLIHNGTNMVAFRYFGHLVNATVSWDGIDTATLVGTHFGTGQSITMSVTAGSSTAVVNGQAQTLIGAGGTVVTAELIGGRFYLPSRAMVNAFGLDLRSTASGGTAIEIFNPNN